MNRKICYSGKNRFFISLVAFGSLLQSLAGCSSSTWKRIAPDIERGEFAQAKAKIVPVVEANKTNRQYMYDRMLLAMLDLADGLPKSAEFTVDEVFDVLRTQGINADKTVASVVSYEGIKFWKGEPFEQAMMFYYTALQKAMLGEWDNARAAASNSLFLLKNFGEDQSGARKSTLQIAAEAAQADKAKKGKDKGDRDFFDTDYHPVETTFALGYVLKGIANLAIANNDPDRKAEAEEDFKAVEAISGRLNQEAQQRYERAKSYGETQFGQLYQKLGKNPTFRNRIAVAEQQWRIRLESMHDSIPDAQSKAPLEQLRSGEFNTVLVVDCGLGPTKCRYGPYGALATFQQQRGWKSDSLALHISIGNEEPQSVSPVCDLNIMATDHMWHSMEEVRVAKGHLGAAIATSGVAMMSSGNNRDAAAGLAVALIGLAIMDSAKADIRHCEFMPQRVYLAPIRISKPNTIVTIRVGDDMSTQMVLCGFKPPEPPNRIQLRYVRMTPTKKPPGWMTSGKVFYANDNYTDPVVGDDLPYILGGRCVKRPTQEVLSHYQQTGHLQGFALADLESLYREEGIKLNLEEEPGHRAGLHILEGGTSMECPLAGTAGFARLFCQEHAVYRPRTARVRELAAKYAMPSAAASVASR